MMEHDYRIVRNAPLVGRSIEELRGAVGWDRMDNAYDKILSKSYAHFSASDSDRLIGFVNVISDGIGDAFLVDFMVHPEHQHGGLASAIVTQAIEELTEDGIQCIQVVFRPELAPFYRMFGFEIVSAGIIDLRTNRMGKLITVHCAKCGDFLVRYETDDSGKFVGILATRMKASFKVLPEDPDQFPKVMYGVCMCGGETPLNWLD